MLFLPQKIKISKLSTIYYNVNVARKYMFKVSKEISKAVQLEAHFEPFLIFPIFNLFQEFIYRNILM